MSCFARQDDLSTKDTGIPIVVTDQYGSVVSPSTPAQGDSGADNAVKPTSRSAMMSINGKQERKKHF